MVIVEKSFPRGGVPSSATKAEDAKTNIIFGATQQKIKKPKAKTTKETKDSADEVQETEPQLKSLSAELLNYETIQDGMNIMGAVTDVEDLYLTISLPGRMTARASALEISDAYTKATKRFLESGGESTEDYKPLKDLYRVGQLIYARVQAIKEHRTGRKLIDMSLKPSEVHTDLQHMNIKKGFIFNGAIEEVQEHGYIIESGIRGLRTFVPLENSKEGHVVGELIYLQVTKITHDKVASTCICKETKLEGLKVKSNQIDPNIDYILPISIVKFKVAKQLKDGLSGTILNERFNAYVNEHQLEDALALPEDYEANKELSARILYVMPLTKLVYLTLNLHTKVEQELSPEDTEEKLKPGDVITNARVHHLGTGGVVLILNNKYKGILSYRTIKSGYKGNYDQDALLIKYAKKTKHKVRILQYDVMDSMYLCTDNAAVVQEKVFSLDDVQPGEFITATVKKKDELIGGYLVKITPKLKGLIEKIYLAPGTKNLEANAKLRCRIIGVNAERNMVYLTNRPEYLATTCKVLTSLSDAKSNATFTGTVVKNHEGFVLVKFFNDLKGVLHKNNLSGLMATESQTFFEGQTMKFRIASRTGEQISLTLPEETFSLGEICPIEIVNSLDSGLEIKISYAKDDDSLEVEEFKGLVPTRLLSDYTDLLLAKKRVLLSQSESEAVCIVKNIFSVRDVKHFRENITKDWSSVQPGDILRAYIKNVNEEVVELLVPIRNYNKLVKVHLKMLVVNAFQNAKIEFVPEQIVYIKVLSKEPSTKTLTISAKLTDVWSSQLSDSAAYVASYLNEVEDIKRSLRKQSAPIGKYAIGDKISALFQGVNTETKDWLYEIEKTKVLAVLRPSFFGNAKPPKVGEKQECIVLWIDYSNDLLLISNKSFDIAHITKSKDLSPNLVGKNGINAKVLLKLENVVICSLKKGDNPLIYCPKRLHYNDFEESCSTSLKEGDFCKLAFVHEKLPIAVPENIWKLWKDIKRKTADIVNEEFKNKRAKMERITPITGESEKQVLSRNVIFLEPWKKHKLDKKSATTTEPLAKKSKIESPTKKSKDRTVSESSTQSDIPAAALFFEDKEPENVVGVESNKKSNEPKFMPGVKDFWSTDLTKLNASINGKDESSDEEDENENESAQQKKHRLSSKEKFKLQREEESRLRAIEDKMADPNYMPETADQFDRLLLGSPNDSKKWINYMAFHLQSAEIDRAREVARRALKTISFRESNELLNIWMALLNLELRYGTEDSFDETFKEALLRNDPLKIHLRTVEIYSDTKKSKELIELVGIITKKFRTEPEVWSISANAFFSLEMTERAQQLLQRALLCLPEREHVNTIVTFANLNHKYGHNEMAQTLLDQIVTSYPKRVDVWTQYVDLLVKTQLIDSARTILERAVIQKIPLKKMRTIFKKYLEFEQRFGNEDSVQKVKVLATEFVKNSTTL